MIFRERVAGILAERRPNQDAPAGYRRAAVLLPLYESPEGPHVILTKRTELVPTHKGQISFPGGGFQEEDRDLLATALRESAEEIGLRREDVCVAGVLDDVSTAASSNTVRPFVGFVPHPYPFQPDIFEIECVIHLPLTPLFERDRFREEVWDRNGRPHSVFFYEYGAHTIWGLTARILKQFVEVVVAPLRRDGWLQ